MKRTIWSVGCLLLMALSWQADSFNENNLQKLKASNECQQCDLIGVNLAKENLERVNLTGSDLTGANLERANLTRADLSLVKGLDAVTLCETIMPDGVVNNSGC